MELDVRRIEIALIKKNNKTTEKSLVSYLRCLLFISSSNYTSASFAVSFFGILLTMFLENCRSAKNQHTSLCINW